MWSSRVLYYPLQQNFIYIYTIYCIPQYVEIESLQRLRSHKTKRRLKSDRQEVLLVWSGGGGSSGSNGSDTPDPEQNRRNNEICVPWAKSGGGQRKT